VTAAGVCCGRRLKKDGNLQFPKLEAKLLSKKTGGAIAKAVMNHIVTNSFTYIQLIGALLAHDYVTLTFLAKKLFLKTAVAFSLKQFKALKEKPDDSKRN
jgi:hypothetical protein